MNEPASTPPALPALPSPEVRAAIDAEHLRLLRICYFVSGGFTAVVSCFFILHFVMFLFVGLNPHLFDSHSTQGTASQPPPREIFLFFAAGIGLVILLGWIFGAAQVYAGRCIGRREHLLFVTILAVIECIFIPWGTLLGVLTMLVLQRPTVKMLFDHPRPTQA